VLDQQGERAGTVDGAVAPAGEAADLSAEKKKVRGEG
jgi:hypothetical protein